MHHNNLAYFVCLFTKWLDCTQSVFIILCLSAFRTLCGCRVRVEMSNGEKRSRFRGPPPSWSRRPRDDYRRGGGGGDDYRRRSPPARRRYNFFFFQMSLDVLVTIPFHHKLSYGQNETDNPNFFHKIGQIKKDKNVKKINLLAQHLYWLTNASFPAPH